CPPAPVCPSPSPSPPRPPPPPPSPPPPPPPTSPPPPLSTSTPPPPPPSQVCVPRTLLWSDEFTAPQLDLAAWSYYLGTAYNNEVEVYTNRSGNVRVEGGSLVLEAHADYLGYSSGRVHTRLKRAFYPGMSAGGVVYDKVRIEARIKLPKGQGFWPAFWLLPNSATCESCGPYGAWPYSGDISIMQAVNRMDCALSSMHYGGYQASGAAYGSETKYCPTSYNLALEWHTYALEWMADQMWWYVDDMLYFTTVSRSLSKDGWWTASQTSTAPGANAPFDSPFYIIFNLAIGGTGPGGGPDATTTFPARMLVDYVRVWGY
ncbi:hypothetical protein Agub_g3287, partial [Astrephomene gubernaculifera]